MSERSEDVWSEGFVVAAAALMMISGLNQFLIGLAAVFRDTVFIRIDTYIYAFDLTTWGWVHMLLGVAVGALGACILMGMAWARAVGIGVISLAVVLNMLWLPYTPWWTMIQIGLCVLCIWGLAAWSPRRSLA